MPATFQTFVTSGDIARELDRDKAQVRHVLASRRDIIPVGHAGLTRLYAADVIDRVREELETIDDRRS